MEGEGMASSSGPLSISAGDVIIPSTGASPTSSTSAPGSGARSSSRRSRSRDGSRRHRSSTRSRSRHSRSGQSRSRIRFKRKERNFPAAVCSMVTIVIICTAIAEPRWISLQGGDCHLSNRGKLTFLGVFQFFYTGTFSQSPADHSASIYNYGPSNSEVMVNCVTMHAVFLFKSMLAFCFLAIACSLCAFLLDLTGPSNRAFRIIRRNAIFSIMTVILCVIVNLLCYWITTVVGDLQKATRDGSGEVEVTFDVSFYLLTAAGVISVLGTACNCLKRYPPSRPDTTPYLLLDDYDELEAMLGSPTFSSPGGSSEGSASPENLPPPPPYTP